MQSPSTPPRSSRMRPRTPPSPMHGPMNEYSPPRRSSRKTLNNNPYSSTNTFANTTSFSNKTASLQTPATKKSAFGLGYAPSDCFSSPPASPAAAAAAPEMRKQFLNTPRRVFDNSNLNNGGADHDLRDPSSSARKPFMLPTPTKTPTMTPAGKHSRAASMQESARALYFQPDDPNDSMPSRKQSARATKFRRLDFESDDIAGSSRTGAGNGFQIYTESQARVPHLDTSGNNPFYRTRANTIPQDPCPSPPLIRQKTMARIEEERAMDAAAARDEGLIYTFRGRKVFHRFDDADTQSRDPGSTLSQRALKRSAGAAAERPITRSQIKPRMIFPPDDEPLDPYTDEEAETDIDLPAETVPKPDSDHVMSSVPATPAKTKAKAGHMVNPASTGRAPRKRNAIDVPVYDDGMSSASKAAAGLPTPARSVKKKRVNFQEGTPEPNLAGDGHPVAASSPSVRHPIAKKKQVLNLTPVVEDESESESELAGTASTPTAGPRPDSPFDQWPRTKGGVKRDGEALAGGASKRTRSAVAAGSISA